MAHDIGQLKRDEAAATRQRIVDYMAANPVARQQECARDLGLNVMTVSRHITAMRVEWLAQRQQEQASA